MTTIKTEGFSVPGAISIPSRPHITRPFSDGSMAIETDVLSSLDHHLPIAQSFFPQSLPSQFSPHSAPLDLGSTSPHAFHNALFAGFKFDNPEPPVTFGQSYEPRPRSLSSSRSFLVSKRPGTRQPRKLSMTEATQRGRGPHPRTMSHSDAFPSRGLGIALATHNEGERSDSISPPEFAAYGIPIASSWNSNDAPSLVPGSFGSYSVPEEAVMDSPMTPAQTFPPDDSYKKQRRRECHNQVEKRRREHINAKIEELSQLLPAHYTAPEDAIEDDEEEEPGASPMKKKKTKRSASTAKQKDAAHCKGRILSQSVQYIYDLKHITEMQANRILQLESMLSIPAQQFWPDSTFAQVARHSNLAPLAEHSQLTMLQPNPDGQSSSSLPGWQHPSEELMAFQPSPTEHSSGSNNFRRSSSLSTTDSGEKVESGGSPDKTSPIATKGADMELQLSMSGMDIDAMFGNRREDANGIRW